MTISYKDGHDPEFIKRRLQAREKIRNLDGAQYARSHDRSAFFDAVYERAESDAAQIPWADLSPKPHLARWLAGKSGNGKTAIDIACGLGDNAEALNASGFKTTAFDLADTAITWAKKRFPDSAVDYRTASLFDLPAKWHEAFDLVNEIYTLQALPPTTLEKSTRAIASLVKPGGTLLVYAILRPENREPDGPPWPLSHKDAREFANLGFELVEEERFDINRGERKIPHQFAQWTKIS